MAKFLLRLTLLSCAIYIATYYMPSVVLTNYWYAIWVALVLSAVNVTIKPILSVLSFPITLLTFGLFLLVINALMVLLVDYLLVDFSVGGFWNALLFSVVVSLVYWILDSIFGNKKKA